MLNLGWLLPDAKMMRRGRRAKAGKVKVIVFAQTSAHTRECVYKHCLPTDTRACAYTPATCKEEDEEDVDWDEDEDEDDDSDDVRIRHKSSRAVCLLLAVDAYPHTPFPAQSLHCRSGSLTTKSSMREDSTRP